MKLRLATLFLLFICSCAPIIIGTGGKLVLQEKQLGDSISDTTIWIKIKSALNKKLENIDLGNITISVSEGRVLLTGSLKKHEDMIKILRLIWVQDGVKDVINEIEISNTGFSVKEYAKDSWITTQIKSKMLINGKVHIKAINYSVETIRGIVYLFGISKTREEIQAIEDIAYSISGVKDVRSHIRIKEDDIRNKLDQIAKTRNSNNVHKLVMPNEVNEFDYNIENAQN